MSTIVRIISVNSAQLEIIFSLLVPFYLMYKKHVILLLCFGTIIGILLLF